MLFKTSIRNRVIILGLFFVTCNTCIADNTMSVDNSNIIQTTQTNSLSNNLSNSNFNMLSINHTNNNDPLQSYNRIIFNFNTKADFYVVKPSAQFYIKYIPLPIRTIIANFFNNLKDFISLGNDILQLNGQNTMEDTMRIALNTGVGLFGSIDVASQLGLVRHGNNFAKTLQQYGWYESSYFVIPLMGPSTIRDTIGLAPDIIFNPTWYLINSDYISIGLFTISAIDTRAKFLNSDQLIYDSLDPYITMRDFYLQTHRVLKDNKNNINIDDVINDN